MTDTETTSRRSPVISIVGLGRVGVALGLALQQVKSDFRVWGHDRDHDRGKAASKAKAVDKTSWNLIEVAEEADLVFLTEPLDQMAETLEAIAPHVREGSLITDTAGAKVPVMALAERLVPREVSFIGGHPIPRDASATGSELFAGAPYCLVPAPGASDKSVDVLSGLVNAIGAQPYFIGADEHDALVAGVRHLPIVLSSAYLKVIADSPSARDLHRLSPGAIAPGAIAGADAEEREAVLANAANVHLWLDQAIAGLVEFRSALAEGDAETLSALLEDAEAARAKWGAGEDQAGDDGTSEELRDINPLRDMIFGRGFRRKKD